MKKIIIAAVAQNGVIGNNGTIPWHSKEDFKHFKQTTMGFPIIMGRKCFESLKQPLKGRLNIIVTRNKNFVVQYEEAAVADSIEAAITLCKNKNYEKVFIIGGGEIYNQSIGIADEMIISKMKLVAEGNISFPEIDEKIWKIESVNDFDEFSVVYYTRIKQKED